MVLTNTVKAPNNTHPLCMCARVQHVSLYILLFLNFVIKCLLILLGVWVSAKTSARSLSTGNIGTVRHCRCTCAIGGTIAAGAEWMALNRMVTGHTIDTK